jgi:hypothetical protein
MRPTGKSWRGDLGPFFRVHPPGCGLCEAEYVGRSDFAAIYAARLTRVNGFNTPNDARFAVNLELGLLTGRKLRGTTVRAPAAFSPFTRAPNADRTHQSTARR